MEISAAFLCDFAEVREGLLMAVGGGITRIWRPAFPSPIPATLALLLTLLQSELDVPHDISLTVQGPDRPVGGIKGGFQIGRGLELGIGETVVAPLTLDLRPISLPEAASYTINITVGQDVERSVSFVAQPASAPPT